MFSSSMNRLIKHVMGMGSLKAEDNREDMGSRGGKREEGGGGELTQGFSPLVLDGHADSEVRGRRGTSLRKLSMFWQEQQHFHFLDALCLACCSFS